jgi:hypothetical protein
MRWTEGVAFFFVITGLVPVIHVFFVFRVQKKNVDDRDKARS